MRPRSELSLELYDLMMRRGYPQEFCDAITYELNTDFTARRMIGYLNHFQDLPMEEVADEMLAILTDREVIIRKKQLEYAQQGINEFYENRQFYVDDEE